MSKIQTLRGLVNQRLTAAAEEIFELFERTIAEYEEQLRGTKEKQHKLLDSEVRSHSADVQQPSVRKEEVPPEQQERSSSLDQEDPPEPPHIKEEQEKLWSSQEGDQFQGLEEEDVIKFTFYPVKSEGADGEDCGGSEPGRNLNPDRHLHLQPGTDEETSHSESEASEPQPRLNPVSGFNPVGASVSFSERASRSDQTEQREERPFTSTLSAHVTHPFHRFSCKVCLKEFSKRDRLVRHMRIHTGEKPFSCSVCGRSFTQKSHLCKHQKVHMRENEHTSRLNFLQSNKEPVGKGECNTGQTSGSSSERAASSDRKKHKGEKPFCCSVCGKRFATKNCLKRHAVCHSGEKPFSCSVCGKRFALRESLKLHSSVHSGEKPFSCSLCGQTFSFRGALRRHALLHTGERPHRCSVCDKRFTRPDILKAHRCVRERRVKL